MAEGIYLHLGEPGTGKPCALSIDMPENLYMPRESKEDLPVPACLGLYIQWVVLPSLQGDKSHVSLAREILVVGPTFRFPAHLMDVDTELLDLVGGYIGMHIEPTRIVDYSEILAKQAFDEAVKAIATLGRPSDNFPDTVGRVHSAGGFGTRRRHSFGSAIATSLLALPAASLSEEEDAGCKSWLRHAGHFNPRGRRKKPK